MVRSRSMARWCGFAAVLGSLAGTGALAFAADPPGTTGAARPAAVAPGAEAEAAPAKFRGRLPRYYGKVVVEKQRQRIYAIQRKYIERERALEAELEKLRSSRDAEVEAVLTAEQRTLLDKLLATARKPVETAAETTE